MTKGLQDLLEKGNEITLAIHRFRNNESTYVSYLKKFLVDPTYEQFKFCVTSKDYEHARSYCSALNGVASNLGLTNIAKCTASLSYRLYKNDFENMKLDMETLESSYNETVSLIERV